jgi:glycosyltransferase involved in cell wall biosynthesis
MFPKLSVILPFHRADSYFSLALDSLTRASGEFHVIIVDDRMDNSQSISTQVASSLESFELLVTKGGEGYGEALRVGTTAVETEFLALFNSDDLVAPDRFTKQLLSIGNSDISITNLQRISSSGKPINSMTGIFQSPNYSKNYLLLGAYGANASWLVRKEWWDNHSFFDEFECLDWRIALKNFATTDISYIREPLYFYRKHASQVTKNHSVSSSKMQIVYEEWLKYSAAMGLGTGSYDIFSFLALPWNAHNQKNLEEINTYVEHLIEASMSSPELANDIVNLVARRYLLNIKNMNSIYDVLYCLTRGKKQILSLILDLISQ